MQGTAIATEFTYEAYMAMPESMARYEIIDGELVMSPTPTGEHNVIADNITTMINRFTRAERLGVAVSAPWDVLVERSPLRTRQPDVLYLDGERTGLRSRKDLRGISVLDVAPDLVVEVLSARNTFSDVLDKLRDYSGIGVRECWLVRPEEETVEVLRLSAAGGETLGKHGTGEMIHSEVLAAFALSVDEVFA